MVRNLDKYTKFQRFLYVFHFAVCSLLFMISLFFVNDKNAIDTALLFTTLIASIFIVANHRFGIFLRLIYLGLYSYLAFQYKLYTDFTLKIIFFYPFAIVRVKDLYLTKDLTKWRNAVAHEMLINRKRKCCKGMGWFYGWLIIGVIIIAILTHLFEDTLRLDNFMSQPFYATMTVVAYIYLLLDYRRNLNRWPFGFMYNCIVAAMWLQSKEISVALFLNILFWIYYTATGTIEAIYLREIHKSRSVYSLYLRDVKDVSRKCKNDKQQCIKKNRF